MCSSKGTCVLSKGWRNSDMGLSFLEAPPRLVVLKRAPAVAKPLLETHTASWRPHLG